jgi:hypothetical protein
MGRHKRWPVTHWSPEQVVAQLPDRSEGGAVQVKRTLFASDFTPVVFQAAGLPSDPFGYANPVARMRPGHIPARPGH